MESPTCGGGSPPAPAGHSGSILLRPPQLHSHRGEGFSMDQLPLSNMSLTLWETCGTDHSSSSAVQGVSLEHRNRQVYSSKSSFFSVCVDCHVCDFTETACRSTVDLFIFIFLNVRFLLKTHSMGSPSMQRVPNPGSSVRAPRSLLMWGSSGKSLLQRHRESTAFNNTYIII